MITDALAYWRAAENAPMGGVAITVLSYVALGAALLVVAAVLASRQDG